jgi:xylulose-5-phosphate/fructose-6-phosphate phosphoketolase
LKFIDPAESGAVLPILHVNGFKVSSDYHRGRVVANGRIKISERTIPGTMDDRELVCLYTGVALHFRQCALY